MVIPPPKRSRRCAASPRTAPTGMAQWSSTKVVTPSSSSVPTRMVFLLHGEDSFRTRLRLGELSAALLSGQSGAPTGLPTLAQPRLGSLIGVTRHDARTDSASAIMLSGQAQGLFDAVDEPRVVIVDHAEALKDLDLIASFPREAALVLVSVERLAAGRSRRGQRQKTSNAPAANLLDAVEAAGGSVERIERLAPIEVPRWISARAQLHPRALSGARPCFAGRSPSTRRTRSSSPDGGSRTLPRFPSVYSTSAAWRTRTCATCCSSGRPAANAWRRAPDARSTRASLPASSGNPRGTSSVRPR